MFQNVKKIPECQKNFRKLKKFQNVKKNFKKSRMLKKFQNVKKKKNREYSFLYFEATYIENHRAPRRD